MIQAQVKLKLTPRQERTLDHWLRHLTSVWNWAIRKIEQDAKGGIYYTQFGLCKLLNGHGARIGVSQDAISGTLLTAHTSWRRCFRKQAKRPRFKGRRNRLNSIAFGHGASLKDGRLMVTGLGRVRFHKQVLSPTRISQLRIVKRASGWYACLTMHCDSDAIAVTGISEIGIDPGFTHLVTLSSGVKIEHSHELRASALRLAQSQRGNNRQLTARIHERIQNQRKDRNHKLSRRLVSENQFIAFSADNHHAVAKRFGKSVGDSGHYQLRRMLAYKSKCRADGLGVYVEPPSKNSTRTCSACGALTGPRGLIGLKVREWDCGACGAHHDRDTNSAINALINGAGLAHEMSVKAA